MYTRTLRKGNPLVMTTFGKLGPSAQGFLQSLADVACSTGVVDRGLWLSAMQYLSCALVRGRGIVFRRYYQGIAKSDGKDYSPSSTRCAFPGLCCRGVPMHVLDYCGCS